MKIKKIIWHRLQIPFVSVFEHASARRSRAYSIWVEAYSEQHRGCGEACPRAYVTGEDFNSVEKFIHRYQKNICAEISDLKTLQQWLENKQTIIDSNPAAWCAIELALLDLIARESQQSVESLLGLPALSGCFQYSAILGVSTNDIFTAQLKQYIDLGFTDFKIKLSGHLRQDQRHLNLLAKKLADRGRIRADANNLWRDSEQVVGYFGALNVQLFALEEPLKSFDYSGLEAISKALNWPIILDESFLNISHFNAIKDNPEDWIINLRIAKMGGLLRSLKIIEAAKKLGIRIIVGAQVGETSLLTRAALTIAQAAKKLLVAQEGAFGTLLLQKDVITPSLMFGKGGVLDSDAQLVEGQPGFGLKFHRLD